MTDTFTKGMFLLIDGKLHSVLDRKYKTQGRQGGLIILTLKNLDSGNNNTITIKAGVRMDQVEPNYKEMQYSYNDGDSYYFMDVNTYETEPLPANVIGDYTQFLKEGESYVIMFYNGRAISIRQNPSVELKVTEAAPAVKGNTANAATKIVTTETGFKVAVPLFIEQGDTILINTESATYTKRV